MGGGVSSAAADQMEDMMAYSLLLGRTITCMSFPGMHSIKDFNLLTQKERSKSANAQSKRGSEREVDSPCGANIGGGSTSINSSSSNSLGTTSNGPSPSLIGPELEDKFTVIVDGEVVVLDDVRRQNDEGWTPLHACCHSNTTATVGIHILEEMVRLGGDLDLKTKRGPGSFNSGFTALHMASAYGVAELVEALLKAGADPNCKNDYDWTPLLEVCHRGFVGITRTLVQAGADLLHIPNAEASGGALFIRGAPQSPLGEAARGGFTGICKFLLDAGSAKDKQNHLGWTPLHEACYFNRLDMVQLLLVHGADPTVKNAQGAMPFNLASHQPIKDLLREIGGEEAAKTMPTPSFSLCVNDQGHMFVRVTAGESGEESKGDEEGEAMEKGKAKKEAIAGSPSSHSRQGKGVSPSRSRSGRSRSPRGTGEQKDSSASTMGVLHRGEMLGELPALGRPQGHMGGGNCNRDSDGARKRHYGNSGSSKRDSSSDENRRMGRGLSSGISGGDGLGDRNALRMPGATDEGRAPEGIICQLSKRVARDPVRTPYGHLFDRQMIALWLSKQGSICPLTGQPLVAAELRSDDKAKMEVQAWYRGLLLEKQKKSTASSETARTGSSTGSGSNRVTKKPAVATGGKGKQSSSFNPGRDGASPSSWTSNNADVGSPRGDCRDAIGALDAKAPPKNDKEREGSSDGRGGDGGMVNFGGRKKIDDEDEDGLYEF